jgi:hypothetical protein
MHCLNGGRYSRHRHPKRWHSLTSLFLQTLPPIQTGPLPNLPHIVDRVAHPHGDGKRATVGGCCARPTARTPPASEGVLPACQTHAAIRSGSRRQARLGSMMFSASDAPHADHHRASVGGCRRFHSRVSDPAAMAVGRLALGGGLDLRCLVGNLLSAMLLWLRYRDPALWPSASACPAPAVNRAPIWLSSSG